MNTTDDLITQIPLDQLHESPFNPRKTFTGIEELATSILAEGRVHQPLLVRPRMTAPTAANPADMFDGYEIVFGHRRYRAAERAGLRTVPCMVRSMTGAEARSAQIAENLQRSDVHPFEEAEGFDLLMKSDERTADDLAVMFGKSRSYIYGRLKLLQACPEVRKACLAGEWGSEVALLIARLRTTRLQERALAVIRADTSSSARLDDGGKRSYRHIRDLLAEKFTLELKSAIFPREDDTLLPGAGTCSACPKRTANAPEFEDLVPKARESEHRSYMSSGGADICTDPDCFEEKKKAHLAREAAKLQAAGKTVVTGNKARAAISAAGDVKGDYIALADVKKALPKLGKADKGKAGNKPAVKPADLPAVHIQDPRTGKTVAAVKRADLVAAGVLKADQAKAPQVSHQANEQRRQEERARELAKAEAESARRMALLRHVREMAAGRELGTFELRMTVAAALQGVPHYDWQTLHELHGVNCREALQRKVDTLQPAELTALLLDCILVDNVRAQYYSLNDKPGPLLALANHYQVDAKAIMRAAEPAPAEGTATPSTAGASAKKARAEAGPGKKAQAPAAPKKTKQVKDEAPAVAGAGQASSAGDGEDRDTRTMDLFAEAGK